MIHTIHIRDATPDDAAQLLDIYSYYVTDTAVSFEYEVPDIEEFGQRIRKTLSMYPYLVAESEGKIVGYAYAGPFHSRPAYQWNVETTIYIHKDYRKCGIGKALYEALENALRRQNILNMNACIAVCDVEDEYLTNASLDFHKAMGFNMVGRFTNSGYKFRRWYGIAWMEKLIGEHTEEPEKVKSTK